MLRKAVSGQSAQAGQLARSRLASMNLRLAADPGSNSRQRSAVMMARTPPVQEHVGAAVQRGGGARRAGTHGDGRLQLRNPGKAASAGAPYRRPPMLTSRHSSLMVTLGEVLVGPSEGSTRLPPARAGAAVGTQRMEAHQRASAKESLARLQQQRWLRPLLPCFVCPLRPLTAGHAAAAHAHG